jgi:carbon storage regulator
MLVLSRRERDRIYIGEGPDRIEIYVAEIRGNRVRLGITAPADMRITLSKPNGKETPRDDRP